MVIQHQTLCTGFVSFVFSVVEGLLGSYSVCIRVGGLVVVWSIVKDKGFAALRFEDVGSKP